MTPEEIARDEWEKWLREPYQGATICEDARLLCERVARRVATELGARPPYAGLETVYEPIGEPITGDVGDFDIKTRGSLTKPQL